MEMLYIRTYEDYQFRDPHGVATGPEGTIYHTDSYAQRLFKLNPQGGIRNGGRESWRLFSIKNINNQLFVTDPDNDQVKVFDMDYNLVGIIETKEISRRYSKRSRWSIHCWMEKYWFIRQLSFTPSSLNLSNFYGLRFKGSGHNYYCHQW